MSETVGLAARLTKALIADCDVLKAEDPDTQREIENEIETTIFGEILAMCLEQKEEAYDPADPGAELEENLLEGRIQRDHLRDLCKRQQGEHAAHLDTQAAMHQAEIEKLRLFMLEELNQDKS